MNQIDVAFYLDHERVASLDAVLASCNVIEQQRSFRSSTAVLLANRHSSSTLGASFMAENAATVDLKEFQLHEKDTGSADVQVALLTKRIAQLTEHLKTNAKDHSSRDVFLADKHSGPPLNLFSSHLPRAGTGVCGRICSFHVE